MVEVGTKKITKSLWNYHCNFKTIRLTTRSAQMTLSSDHQVTLPPTIPNQTPLILRSPNLSWPLFKTSYSYLIYIYILTPLFVHCQVGWHLMFSLKRTRKYTYLSPKFFLFFYSLTNSFVRDIYILYLSFWLTISVFVTPFVDDK